MRGSDPILTPASTYATLAMVCSTLAMVCTVLLG